MCCRSNAQPCCRSGSYSNRGSNGGRKLRRHNRRRGRSEFKRRKAEGIYPNPGPVPNSVRAQGLIAARSAAVTGDRAADND